jgi:hypothetical protein
MKALLAVVMIVGAMSVACFHSVTSYTRPDGSTAYVGMFYNNQPGPGYYYSAIQGELFDASGKLIGTAGGFLCGGVDPKGSVAFKAWTPADVPRPARIEWSIVEAPAKPYIATGLEARVTNKYVIGDATYVVGEVTNTSANVYVAATVCAWWTDSDGNVVREEWNNGGAWRLNPHDVVPFSLKVDTPPAGSTIHLFADSGVKNVPGHYSGDAVNVPQSALQHSSQTTVASGGGYVTHGMG